MESLSTNLIANEHDYTALEVPLEAIKQEILEPYVDDEIQEVPSEPSDFVRRVPVVLRDNKPKLRMRKEKPQPRSLLLPPPAPPKPAPKPPVVIHPRPIMPKLQFSLPIPPNSETEPPKNCKGVFVVQDIKVCTMYVPKSENGSPSKMTLPMGAFASSPIVKSTLTPPILVPTKKSNETRTTSLPATKVIPSTEFNNRRKNPLAEPRTISAPTTHTNRKDTIKSTSLIENVQTLLKDKLPLCWFTAVEKDGINIMLLSFGKEKAIQRRLFVSTSGNVEISVHCKPLLDNFVSEILKQAGDSISLSSETVQDFSDWVLKLVHVLRDFHVCLGLEWTNPSEEIIQQGNVMHDGNPYQESRYSETLRSKSCLRLVEAGKRKCAECCKAYSSATKIAKKGTKSTPVQPQKKKRNASVGSESDGTEQSLEDSSESLEYCPKPKAPECSKVKKKHKSLLKNKKRQSH